MPRKGHVFKFRGYWLDKPHGRENWYAVYYDKRTGKCPRQSLGTANQDEAEDRLVELTNASRNAAPTSSLDDLLHSYLERHLSGKASYKTTRSNMTRILNFWGDDASAADVNEAVVEEFMYWARDECGLAASTIGRTLRDLKCAMKFGRIDVSWMCADNDLSHTDKGIAAKLDLPEIACPIYQPSDSDIIAFCNEAKRIQSLWRWSLVAVATAARPQAAIDLGPAGFDPETGEVKLNPPGRRQNKKYRATVLAPHFWRRGFRRGTLSKMVSGVPNTRDIHLITACDPAFGAWPSTSASLT